MKKRFFWATVLLATALISTAFTEADRCDGGQPGSVATEIGTPFPKTGKVTVYGRRGNSKVSVGEVRYTANIDANETSRGAFSNVSVRLTNSTDYEVSGYVYTVENGKESNYGRFTISPGSSWSDSQTVAGNVDDIRVSTNTVTIR